MEGKKLKKEVKKLRKKNKELLEKIKILKKENRRDELTGLGNRKEFKEIGDRIIRKSKREQQAFCLVYVDLDNFKEINDNKGHKVGDEVLI
ncbi:MAG: GGDEF domain-containing protein, partial [Minisyncoccales bacterium]